MKSKEREEIQQRFKQEQLKIADIETEKKNFKQEKNSQET